MKVWVLSILCVALIISSNMGINADESDFCVRLAIGLVDWNPAMVFSISPIKLASLSLSEVEIIITNVSGLSFQPDRSDVITISQNYFRVKFDQHHNFVKFWATAKDLNPYCKKIFSLIIRQGSEELVYLVRAEDVLTANPFNGRLLTTWGRVKT